MVARLATVVCLLSCVSACGSDDAEPCTTEARASVQVRLVDEQGAPVTGSSVKYSLDGADALDCEASLGSYVCGLEQVGEFTIFAEADGFVAATQSVSVGSNGCHPETESVVITLEPNP